MKFRQRTLVVMLAFLIAFTWFVRFIFFRNMGGSSAADLYHSCWPRVHYPRRDETSLHLYSLVNVTFGSNPVYSPDGEGEFGFVNDLPRHTRTPLQVFVIPHSHNDPAWIKTFDSYYEDQTKPILDNIIKFLDKYRDMTFLWTEPIFIDRYFKSISTQDHAKFMSYLKDGRLEIAAGGWISPDEATTTNYALISQMTEGLWWLKSNLSYTPESYWNIDPFGYSQTMPFLLRKARFRHVNVVRVNEKTKQLLRQGRKLEFNWSAFWDREPRGIVASVLPFMLYNTKYSCGPSTAVCLMLDFRQIEGEASESTAVAVDASNVQRIAEQLFEQMEMKSRMYRHNVMMFPIGDDFRYDREQEWSQVYDNFKVLFNFMNKKKEWNVNIRFGTLQDYYREMSKRVAADMLPLMEGDFYPYTDRNEDYWTGYFTTRPLLKRRIRLAEKWIRAAEVFSSYRYMKDGENARTQFIENRMTAIRRDFAFLQHHDAIAGTSKPFVMDVYYENVDRVLLYGADIISNSLRALAGESIHFSTTDFEMDARFENKEKVLAYVNSREETSHECFHVESKEFRVSVTSLDGDAIPCQINPRIPRKGNFGHYEVVFCLTIPGLRVKRVKINHVEPFCTLAAVWTVDNQRHATAWAVHDVADLEGRLTLSTPNFGVTLSTDDGLPTSFSLPRSGTLSSPITVTSSFAYYTGSSSGAYLFMPNSQKAELSPINVKRIWFYDGPIEGGAIAEAMWRYNLRVFKDRRSPLSRAILLQTLFLPTELSVNMEIVYRMTVNDLNSGTDFFTDSNGLALMRRRRQSTLPVQANYYPSTTAAMLEDPKKLLRLNLLLSQSAGVTSISSGTLEVMLMRQPAQDDSRGLGEGVQELEAVPADVFILLEACDKLQTCDSRPGVPGPGDFLSKTASALERTINRPALLFSNNTFNPHRNGGSPTWDAPSVTLSTEFRVINFRRLPLPAQLLLVLRKPGKSICRVRDEDIPIKPEGSRLFGFVKNFLGPLFRSVVRIELSSLTGIGARQPLSLSSDWAEVRMGVNDIVSLIITVKK